ncbi:MAG: AMP-binding protein [Candidatus Zixiibacteriota bacterium]|nr:MAG: AMP-binding protein [candidate division Zixibacteria bacterium]
MQPINPEKFEIRNSIHETILDTCREFPEKTAIIGHGGEGVRYSYGDIEALVAKIAGGLHAGGFGRGDRIAILSENCPEWPLAYLAILAAGCAVVPFDASLKATELTKFLRVSRVKLLLCSAKWHRAAADVIALNDLPIRIATLPVDDPHSLIARAEPEPYVAPDVAAEDTAVIIYTSGTTGDPKGVVLTHGNILANLESIIRTVVIYPNDIFLSVLPLHHTFEATCGFLFPLYTGLTIVYARSLRSRDLFADIQHNRATFLVGVPILFEKLYLAISRRMQDLPLPKRLSFKTLYAGRKVGWKLGVNVGPTLFKSLRTKAGLGSIRMLISGGAPLPQRVAEWFNLIGFSFLPGYGLTECSPVVSVARLDDIRFDSVGPPLPGVKVAIDNPSRDGIGEIKVRGGNNTPGYLDNPDATAELIKEGWLYTGDLGKIEKGHLYITGRKKNLIVSGGGKNIYPEEIEGELNLSDYILESLVFGKEKVGKAGEEIWAVIVPDVELIKSVQPDREKEPSPKDIRDLLEKEVAAVNHRLADYKRIVRFEVRMDEFEKTSTRKIKRRLYI